MKVPNWLKCVPNGSHGSGPIQKKAWKVVSDIVRIRDFSKRLPCVYCGIRLDSWKEGQACHFVNYSTCKGLNKFFDLDNIHLGHAMCNKLESASTGYVFAQNLKLRGIDPDNLRLKNSRAVAERLYDDQVLATLKEIVLTAELPIYPDYWDTILKRLDENP